LPGNAIRSNRKSIPQDLDELIFTVRRGQKEREDSKGKDLSQGTAFAPNTLALCIANTLAAGFQKQVPISLHVAKELFCFRGSFASRRVERSE
jgi:hypothetical protein